MFVMSEISAILPCEIQSFNFSAILPCEIQSFNFDLWKSDLWSFSHYNFFLNLKKDFSNLEPEGQGCGIIMGVTRLLLLGLFYTIQMQFYVLFCTRLQNVSFFRYLRELLTPVKKFRLNSIYQR